MPSPDRYRRRFAYHAWATRRLAGALENPGGEAEGNAEAHERARAFLAHACTADRVWLLRLRGEPTGGVALWPALPPDGVRALARLNAEAWTAWLAEVTGRTLAGTVAYTNTRGEPFETVVGDVLDHVLLHGAYHRGQAAAALREAGTAPPWTDFIAWVRAGEPTP